MLRLNGIRFHMFLQGRMIFLPKLLPRPISSKFLDEIDIKLRFIGGMVGEG